MQKEVLIARVTALQARLAERDKDILAMSRELTDQVSRALCVCIVCATPPQRCAAPRGQLPVDDEAEEERKQRVRDIIENYRYTAAGVRIARSAHTPRRLLQDGEEQRGAARSSEKHACALCAAAPH